MDATPMAAAPIENAKPYDPVGDNMQNWFSYHSPTPEQIEKYASIRKTALVLAQTIHLLCPASADCTAAIRLVRQAVMTANASIACGE